MPDNAICTNTFGSNILGTNASEASITFAANTLTIGTAYTLTVTISKDTRSSSSTLTLTGVAGAGVDLRLVGLPSRVPVQAPLRISMADDGNTSSNYSWTMKQGPATPTYAGPLNLHYLMIAEDSLQSGQQYIFTLTATVNGVITSADANVTVNLGPENGTVSVTPSSGVENETDFLMQADGWKDGDGLDYPLTYAWKYIDVDGNHKDIQTNLLSKKLTRKLIGISNVTHTITVECRIRDSLEQYVERSATVTLTPNENRDTVSSEAIAALPSTDIDDIPGIINTNGAVGTNTQTEVNNLIDAYERWNDAQTGSVTEGNVETSLSMILTLISADGTSSRETDLIAYTNEMAALSLEVGGLYRAQGDDLLNALETVSTNKTLIADTIDLVGTAILQSMLPGENAYARQDTTSGTTQVFKRVHPDQLVASNSTSYQSETDQDLEGHRGAIQVPPNVLANAQLVTATAATAVIDVHFNQFKPNDFDGKIDNKNYVTDYELREVGVYGDTGVLQRYDQENVIAVSGLEGDLVSIDVEIQFLNDATTFGCYFQDGTDANGDPIWSDDGCQLDSVDTERSLITCKCNHLTRFTSFEIPGTTEVVLRTPAIVEDDTDFTRMPIMFYIAILIWIIMIIIIVIDQVWQMKDQRINEDKSFDAVISANASPELESGAPQTSRRTHRALASDRYLLGGEDIYIKNPPGSPVEEEHNEENPRTGVVYGEEPDASDSINCGKSKDLLCRGHLIFGLALRGWPTNTIRAAVVCGAYLVHICFIGIFYHQTEPVEEEYEDTISMTDIDVGPLFWIAIASTVCAFVISVFFVLMHLTRSKIVLCIHVFILVLGTFGIAYMSWLFNTNWSLHWLAAFMISGFLELVAVQTLLWPLVMVLYKPSI